MHATGREAGTLPPLQPLLLALHDMTCTCSPLGSAYAEACIARQAASCLCHPVADFLIDLALVGTSRTRIAGVVDKRSCTGTKWCVILSCAQERQVPCLLAGMRVTSPWCTAVLTRWSARAQTSTLTHGVGAWWVPPNAPLVMLSCKVIGTSTRTGPLAVSTVSNATAEVHSSVVKAVTRFLSKRLHTA